MPISPTLLAQSAAVAAYEVQAVSTTQGTFKSWVDYGYKASSSPRDSAYMRSDVRGIGHWFSKFPKTGSKPSMIDLINWGD